MSDEVRMYVEIQPPAVAQVGQPLRPRLTVSLDGSAAPAFIAAYLMDLDGEPSTQLQGGTDAASPMPYEATEDGASTLPRQFTVFRSLSILAAGKYRLFVDAQAYDADAQMYYRVASVTTDIIDVRNREVAATKPTPAQKALLKDLQYAGFF
ncbi:hypothetical protein PG999_007438 [Apiospora kogelbergensis]|uniref:Velvet factor n=1 Tax=Apiospora kogelbergensis TaxID=1337665 RepID=A0AAW0QYA6_9PEZI